MIKNIGQLDMTTKQVMLGKTPATQFKWHTKNGDQVAEFKTWDWWDGKNISDLEIHDKYRGLGLSYQLLDYAAKKCGAKNLTVRKNNSIAKHVYDKCGFEVTADDDEYYYMTLKERNCMKNMAVKDLKEILNECPDDMPVIIPVIDIDDSNDIEAFRYVTTAGILYDDYMPETEQYVICLNSSKDSAVISDQIRSRDVVCERVLYPKKGENV